MEHPLHGIFKVGTAQDEVWGLLCDEPSERAPQHRNPKNELGFRLFGDEVPGDRGTYGGSLRWTGANARV